jgi:hypothetical protein
MSEPRRISFPVLVDPASGLECLILFSRAILDARGPAFSPSQVYVIGWGPDGQHHKFSVPVAVYELAAKDENMAHFIELDTIRAPPAILVDQAGQPFTRPGGNGSPGQ